VPTVKDGTDNQLSIEIKMSSERLRLLRISQMR
jgi:hypothetical protein